MVAAVSMVGGVAEMAYTGATPWHGLEGTLWGVVNAVTEFVDHHARAQAVDNRLASAWFGRGDDLKTTAMERALALI